MAKKFNCTTKAQSSVEAELQNVLDKDSCLALEPQQAVVEDLPFGELIEDSMIDNTPDDLNTDSLPDDITSEDNFDDYMPSLPDDLDECHADPLVLLTIRTLAVQLKFCETNEQKDTLLDSIHSLSLQA